MLFFILLAIQLQLSLARARAQSFVFLRLNRILNLFLALFKIDDLPMLLLDLGHELAVRFLCFLVGELGLAEPIHNFAALALQSAICLFLLIQGCFLQLADLVMALRVGVELLQTQFLRLQVVLQLGHLVVVISVFEFVPHALDLFAQTRLPRFLAPELFQLLLRLRMESFEFGGEPLSPLTLDSGQLRLHLLDDEQKLRLELLVDLHNSVCVAPMRARCAVLDLD